MMGRTKVAIVSGGVGPGLSGKSAQPTTQLLLIELKHRILGALHKLADRDTQQIGLDELERIVQTLSPEGISLCLSCLYDTDAQQKSVVRRECVKLFGTIASVHGDLLGPHLPKIVSNITRRLKDPDTNIRDACVEAIGTLAAQAPGVAGENGAQCTSVQVFVKPLFDAMSEQNRSLQVGATLCLTRVIQNTKDSSPLVMQRLCPRIVKFFSSPNFLAKAALLAAIGSLFQVAGPGASQFLPSLIPCAVEGLENSDWATRKAGADTLARLASTVGPALSAYKANCLTALEACRFDKVKPVRDSVADALQLWKSIPGADTTNSTLRASVSKDVEGKASVDGQSFTPTVLLKESSDAPKTIDRGSLCRPGTGSISSCVVATKSGAEVTSATSTKRRTPALSDKKLNPEFFRKLEQQKSEGKSSGEWQIEVAVPKGGLSPPVLSPVKELQEVNLKVEFTRSVESEGSRRLPSAGSYRSITNSPASGRPAPARAGVVERGERTEYGWRREELAGNGLRIRAVSRGVDEKSVVESPSPELDDSDPWAEVKVQDRDLDSPSWDATGPAMSHSSSASYDVDGQAVSSADEWTSIQKQLHRLEFQQSNLMGMFQEFMGSVHESMLGLDSRIRGLEKSLTESVPASLGRLTNGNSSGFEGTPGRSLSKFLASSQSLSLKLRKAANASRAAFAERLGGCDTVASDYRGRESWKSAETGSDTCENSLYSPLMRTGAAGNEFVGKHISSQRVNMASSSSFTMKGNSREGLEGEQVVNRRVWDRTLRPGTYGDGLCVRSVWQAAKDEATLEAIRGAGEDTRGNTSEPLTIRTPTLEVGRQEKETFWMLWSRAMDFIRAGDMDSAYLEVMSSGDELLLIRLMSHTGPVLNKLASGRALEMIHTIVQLLQQQSFLDCVLPWIHQVADLISTNGPDCLGLIPERKKELITCLQEAASMEFPEGWMASSVSDVAHQLCSAWSVASH